MDHLIQACSPGLNVNLNANVFLYENEIVRLKNLTDEGLIKFWDSQTNIFENWFFITKFCFELNGMKNIRSRFRASQKSAKKSTTTYDKKLESKNKIT